MSTSGQETEVKFYIRDLKRVEARLLDLGARLLQPRTLETNLRFDLPDARLRSEGRVLRLRQDSAARLTYKGPSLRKQGIAHRQEIEFGVDDFEKARQFLEALGFETTAYYEKYRTTYELPDILVMLDELPYGAFLEIEGQEDIAIRSTAERLGLSWEAAVGLSYLELFGRLGRARALSFRELSFANFAGMRVQAADLGVQAADR